MASEITDDRHKCLLLVGWLEGAPELLHLVRSVVSTPQSEASPELLQSWSVAKDILSGDMNTLEAKTHAADDFIFEAATGVRDTAVTILQTLREQLSSVEFGWISSSRLINPLQLIDLDYANHLASELPEHPSEDDALMFAAPERLNISAQTTVNQNSATIITPFQELHLQAIEPHIEEGEGFEIRFKVKPLPQYILVLEHGGKYFLRSGMHRAFVLARAGMSRIPCFLARNVEMQRIVGPYPVYPQDVLQLPRPPRLLDALDSRLAIKADFQRSRRLLRISAEDFSILVS